MMRARFTRDALRTRARLRALIALGAGALGTLGHAPFDFFPATFIALALLIHLWSATPDRRAAAAADGFFFGLAYFLCGVSWVYVSLNRFGGMAPPLAAIATLGFCAWLALFPALVGWLQARWTVSDALRASLVVPALWGATEWLRGWLLSGFPWLAPGYAMLDTPLAGFAPIGGVQLVNIATVALAGLLWTVAAVPARRRQALAALALLLAAGALLTRVQWSIPAGAPVSASLLQGNIPQSMKFDPARYAGTLATYARLAQESSARLIVLPETALPRFLDQADPAWLTQLDATARRNGGDLLLGAPTRSPQGDYHNSVVSFGTAPHQAYHKVHLVAFGEFIPPGFGWALRLLSIPLSDFASGRPTQRPLEVAGQRVAVNICYEDLFGEEILRQLPEATLLVNVSNVAWFGDSLAPAQHLAIARMRTLETARAMLTATNTGITAAIDRDARVLGRLPQFQEGRLEASVQGYTGATPYVMLAEIPLLAAILLLLAAARLRRSAGR